MKTLRTPDQQFENLEAYPFEPHYTEIDDGEGGRLRMHYVDEGPREGDVVVCFHGQPTWSYLYRKMIPVLTGAGHRVLAPDLIGFGRSDKPTEKSDYSYACHVDWMQRWLANMSINDATFFGQDWGSLIGLAMVARETDRFARVVIANGGLPNPNRFEDFAEAVATSKDPEAFSRWQTWIQTVDELSVSQVITGEVEALGDLGGGHLELSEGERRAYDAPFPDASYQAGALIFPLLINPRSTEDPLMQIFADSWEVFEAWEKPFLTVYGKTDTVLGFFDTIFQKRVPGAAGQPHHEFPDGTHFIQDHKGEEVARIVNDFIAAT